MRATLRGPDGAVYAVERDREAHQTEEVVSLALPTYECGIEIRKVTEQYIGEWR